MKTRKPGAESVQFREAWHPMDGVTYLNFAFNAPIPTVALDAVQVSIRAKQLPHLVGDAEFLGRQPVCAAHSPHSLARIQMTFL